jgi:hypothetical protein
VNHDHFDFSRNYVSTDPSIWRPERTSRGFAWSLLFVVSAALLLCLFPNIGELIGIGSFARWLNPIYLLGVTAFFVACIASTYREDNTFERGDDLFRENLLLGLSTAPSRI